MQIVGITCDASEEITEAKLTGIAGEQVVTRIGDKRVLLECSDDLRAQIEDIIPRKVRITYKEDTLLSYEELQQTKRN